MIAMLDWTAGVARRIRLKGLSRNLWARSMQRFEERHHRGERDAKENERTSPPPDERVEVHSIWMVEVFPPSLSGRLGKALRKLPSGGIYRPPDEDLADEVARARRHPMGGGWWNFGVYDNALRDPRPATGRIDLSPSMDHLFLTMCLLTPSLACVVGQFVLTDEAASRIEAS